MSSGLTEGSVFPVRVAVRIRPLSKKEIGDGCEEALDKPLAGRPQVVLNNCNDKAFTYDFAYGSNTEQIDMFKEAINPLVDQLFKGIHKPSLHILQLWGKSIRGRSKST